MGRHIDTLTNEERRKLAGRWVALEIYTPERTPLRIIEALGASPDECVAQIRSRGLDPAKFQFLVVTPAF